MAGGKKDTIAQRIAALKAQGLSDDDILERLGKADLPAALAERSPRGGGSRATPARRRAVGIR